MSTVHTVILYGCAAAVVAPGTRLLMELTGAATPPDAARAMWRRPVPVAATMLVALMAAMAVVQSVFPDVVGLLQRDPDGGWWRCGTALLVQSSGWFQLAFNLAALLAVVPVAARIFGSAETLLVYLVSGVTAQAVSMAGWQPHGAGNSVAICGLVGALATGYALRGRRLALRRLALLIPAAGVVLCAVTNNHGVGILVGGVLGVVSGIGRGALAGRWPTDSHQGPAGQHVAGG